MNWSKFLKNKLEIRKIEKLWRKRRIIENYNTRIIYINKKKYINFSSNNYLGLSHNKNIIESWKIALNKYGSGSGGSGHIIGYNEAHYKLEKDLENWLDYPQALLFHSGYSANQSIITTLMNKKDLIIADKLSHISLIESSIFSKAKLKRFPHNRMDILKKFSIQNDFSKKLIITEGVFSMDGDHSPLNKIHHIAKKNNAFLLVDDAHGIGVLGKEGKGSCEVYNIKPDLLIITFGKAFGLSGAALLCNKIIGEYFLQYSKGLIYSTSIPPAQASALSKSILQIRKSDCLRNKLNENINYFRKLIKNYNFPFLDSHTAIQPLIIGDNQKSLKLSNFLKKNGFFAQAILPPSVPKNSSRLRITITANHLFIDFEKLVELLNYFFNKKK